VGIEQFDQLREVRERSRKTVDLVYNDDVDLAGADILQQLLKVGTVGGPAGGSVRFWSKLAKRADIAGPVPSETIRSSTCLVL
jgi:hypothetical protein